MPTIQLYQHQSQLHSQAGPRANPNVFGAQTAQALGAVSEQIGQIGQKLADTADYRALTEYQLEEQNFAAKQEKWLLDNPHAEKDDILKRYKVERDAFNQSQLKKKHLSRRARERIGLMTQEATVKGELATTQVARTREIKRSQALSGTVKKQAIDAGDLDGFILRVDQDIEHGIMDPAMRDSEIARAKQQIQQNQIMRMVNTDPMQAKELLEERDEDGNPTQFDQIDEATRFTLINHAERNFSQLAQNTFEDLATRINEGEVIGSKELDDLVAQRMMSGKQARAVLKMQSTGKFDAAAYAELHNTILAYDPALDQNNQQHAQFLGAILAMPPAHATELRKLLAEKQKGSSSPLNKPATQEILKRMDERFKHGLYGAYEEYQMVEMKDEAGNVTGEAKRVKKVNQASYEIALANLTRAKDEVRRFVQANPTASEYEINAHLRTFQDEMMGRVARDLLGNLINETVTDLTNTVNAPSAAIRYGLWNRPTPANLVTKGKATRLGY